MAPSVKKEKENGQDLIAVPGCKKYYFDTVIQIRRSIEKERLELKSEKELLSAQKRARAMLGNSVINPAFAYSDHAQLAMLSGNSEASALSQTVKKKTVRLSSIIRLVIRNNE